MVLFMLKKIVHCIHEKKVKLLLLTLKNSRPGSMANSINVVFFANVSESVKIHK